MKKTFISLFRLILCLVIVMSFIAIATGSQKEEGTEKEAKQITITMWDQFTTGGAGGTAAGPAFVKILSMFQAENPHVKLERTVFGPMEIRDQMRLALAADKAPDLFYTWPEGGVVAGYAADGLLYDMTEDAKALGWFERFNKTSL